VAYWVCSWSANKSASYASNKSASEEAYFRRAEDRQIKSFRLAIALAVSTDLNNRRNLSENEIIICMVKS